MLARDKDLAQSNKEKSFIILALAVIWVGGFETCTFSFFPTKKKNFSAAKNAPAYPQTSCWKREMVLGCSSFFLLSFAFKLFQNIIHTNEADVIKLFLSL